jgi:molybdopterin molybdotransferase
MMGHKNLYRKMIRATLEEDLAKEREMRYFVRGHVHCEAGSYYVRSTGEQGSGMLKSMVLANGLIVLPEQTTSFRKGEEVFVQLLDRSMEQTDHTDCA